MSLVIADKNVPEGKAVFVERKIGADTYIVLADSSKEYEDEYAGLYYSSADQQNVFIEPPFNPKFLYALPYKNNILSQCIEAMEVNIDGTGYTVVANGENTKMSDEDRTILESFFDEPYPGKNMIAIRRELRRDMEHLGYGFLEVVRTLDKTLFGLRYLDARMLRLCKLDAPVEVERTILRNGKEVKAKIKERHRRFGIRAQGQNIFYREFGSSRELNRDTGEWETDSSPVPVELRATELLYFTVNKDVETPYGLPRWINQLPSVLGSRKAEEENLTFFDAGGIPPAIIFVQGGVLAPDVTHQLKQYLSGANKSKHRAVVVEATSSSGTLDSAGSVQVRVERFGSEKGGDAQWKEYDKSTEEHVRTGFRLPPMFLGKSQDYSFATAQISYLIAEAQVFAPERTEFDSKINDTLVKELGVKTALYKSNPIVIKDPAFQLSVIQGVGDIVDGEEYLREMNTLGGFSFEYKEPEPPAPSEGVLPPKEGGEVGLTDTQEGQSGAKEPSVKNVVLARKICEAEGLIQGSDWSEEDRQKVLKAAEELPVSDRDEVNRLIVKMTFGELESSLMGEIAHKCC